MSVQKKRCILIAEDDMLVAMMLEDLMQQAGYRVCMTSRVAHGLELIDHQSIDVAILDINLAGQSSFQLAEALHRRHVPFLFASGYGSDAVPEAYRNEVVLQKPYGLAILKTMIETLLDE